MVIEKRQKGESRLRRSLSRTAFVLVLLSCAHVSKAGLLEISYTSEVVSYISGVTEQVTGQFVVDTDVAWTVSPTSGSGVIVSGSFAGDSISGEAIADSPFTFGLAGIAGDGLPFIDLIADAGPFLFQISLTSFDFFPTDNVYDSLTAGLTLDDLYPFDPSRVVSTRFGYTTPTFDFVEGALTSLVIRDLSAVDTPPMTWLLVVGVLALFVNRPRAS